MSYIFVQFRRNTSDVVQEMFFHCCEHWVPGGENFGCLVGKISKVEAGRVFFQMKSGLSGLGQSSDVTKSL